MGDIALVCSLGGHLAEMELLKDLYEKYNYFFIICKDPFINQYEFDKCYVIDNIELTKNRTLLKSYIGWLFINFIKIYKIFIKEKPKIIMSTGPSGLTIPAFFLGKVLGIKTIFIESIGRFSPSFTGKKVYNITDKFIVRNYQISKKYGKKAEFYGEKIKRKKVVGKKNNGSIIFVTVGSSSFSFSRIIKKMDEITPLLPFPVIIQTGNSTYKPKNAKYSNFYKKEKIVEYYNKANIVVGHAATGTFLDFAKYNVKGIMLPRRKEYGEVINNHQFENAKVFSTMGVSIVYNTKELEELLLHHRDTISKVNFNFESENQRILKVLQTYINNILNEELKHE